MQIMNDRGHDRQPSKKAIEQYAHEVEPGLFRTEETVFQMDEDERVNLESRTKQAR
jgi:hypothetical protein